MNQPASSHAATALATAVAELRRELAALEAGDTAARARIERLLAQLEHEADAGPGLQQALGDSLREFEIEHPQLTAALERVLLALSSMGI